MSDKQKINHRFILAGLFCLLIVLASGVFAFSAAPAMAQVNPITGMQQSAQGTGLDRSANLPEFIGDVIKGILGIIGVLFLILLIYAGILWLIARGDDAKIKKAREIIIASLTGFIIVMISYGLTSFVISLFKAA